MVPEWEQIWKPITPLGWATETHFQSAGSSQKWCPPTLQPTLQRKKVQKGVKVGVEWTVTHASHHISFSSYKHKHNIVFDSWNFEIWIWFSHSLSQCFFIFAVIHDPQPKNEFKQNKNRTSCNGMILFLIATPAGSFSSWSLPSDKQTMEGLVRGANLECQGWK